MKLQDFNGVDSLLWPTDDDYPGRIRDERGYPLSGFKVKTFKKTRLVSVLGGGTYLRHYRFPLYPEAPQHPMIHWGNVPYCGLHLFDEHRKSLISNAEILSSVLSGTKPVGDLIYQRKDIEHVQAVAADAASKEFEVFNYTRPHVEDTHVFLMVGVNKPLGELFDLDAVGEYYDTGIGPAYAFVTEMLDSYKALTPIQVLNTYNWSSPGDWSELILTGLCLGYSVESTLAIILE